jgi:hypothetical protein
MAVGPPGKWQAAVEIAGAWSHVACVAGSRVSVVCARSGQEPRVVGLQKVGQWASFSRALFALRAESGADLHELLGWRGLVQRWSQVICVGDLFDVEPSEFQRHLRGSVPWTLIRVMAPLEATPDPNQPVLWSDPEGREVTRHAGGVRDHWAYMQALASNQDAWLKWASQHRVTLHNHLSSHAFEEVFLGAGPSLKGVL